MEGDAAWKGDAGAAVFSSPLSMTDPTGARSLPVRQKSSSKLWTRRVASKSASSCGLPGQNPLGKCRRHQRSLRDVAPDARDSTPNGGRSKAWFEADLQRSSLSSRCRHKRRLATASSLQRVSDMRLYKLPRHSIGEIGLSFIRLSGRLLWSLIPNADAYRPEEHYMRGPGPKCRQATRKSPGAHATRSLTPKGFGRRTSGRERDGAEGLGQGGWKGARCVDAGLK